tara:strand:- start:747 stop:1256 length:510 start_codon:yes stop_codon:yes gene_type:complete
MGYNMQGFSGFGSPVKQVKKSDKLNIKPKGSTATAKATKMMMGPKKPSYFGKMTDQGKAVNYINKANRFKYTFDDRVTGKGNLEKANQSRKFSSKARNVGKIPATGLGKTLSKFFGSKALGVLGLMGSAPLGASSTPKRKVVKSKKPNFKAINRDLQQAIYQGNKKRNK